MGDPVRDYLRQHGYADYIVEGGVEYLLSDWESLVDGVAAGEPPAYNLYLKGLDRRRILEEALALTPLYEQAWYHPRIYAADTRFRQHVVETAVPLCGPVVAAEKGYSPERHWWYFRRPQRVEWPEAA